MYEEGMSGKVYRGSVKTVSKRRMSVPKKKNTSKKGK